MKKLFVALALAVVFQASVPAKEAQPLAEDPAIEKRLVALAQDLRCLVCQNESLAGSHAELANDLRQEIREMMRAGKSDQEIVDFLVQRYGDFVLYKPPVKSTTVLLWTGPFVLFATGVTALVLYLGRRRRRLDEHALSEEEKRRVAELLNDQTGEDKA